MKTSEWKQKHDELKEATLALEKSWKAAQESYDTFLKETLGIGLNQRLEPDNFLVMVNRIFDMKQEG